MDNIQNPCMLANMILSSAPAAIANISGSGISGAVKFYQLEDKVLVVADISGLPKGNGCDCRVFGFHIHEGESCGGESFADTKGHYNPSSCPHPCHSGDMPPLFGYDGKAWLAFVAARFNVFEIIGKTVVIHDMPDDFTTQPAGNSGIKIACGEIKKSAT